MIFFSTEILWRSCNFLRENLFLENTWALCPSSLALKSSATESRSLASDFVVSVALASSLVSSTPPLLRTNHFDLISRS